ncbi:Putative Flp pilus-assembly TadE/G-like/von Willebrand factor type A domain [Hoeflea sp. IMCC20628]|uniref:vWA domain-containing protein n=1 Tax=Hoeflea sp. IMCC20628 TaxID=1620421 RepID=UPI00063AF523|nr:pilus assembly protein [Hoeflea sp. IMCC20628]AKI01341.1 Putative Flp pilus-assembly TadE/G-like/von Willebrand factor type A domain [Hoeflea sp. IMCC20628]
MAKSRITRKIANLLGNTDGNFAMMASIMLPVMFVAGSLALDTTNALSMKTRLQNAADSAALATTSQLAEEKIVESEAKAYAINFFNGQIADDANAFSGFAATPTVTVTQTGTGSKTVWTVEVVANGSQDLSGLARFMGKETIDVTISGTSESARDGSNPLSMMLVLDRSGSMDWASGRTKFETVAKYCGRGWRKYQCGTTTQEVDVPKIDVLKEAVGLLTVHLQTADLTNEYTRMGAVSYNSETKSGDKRTMTWTKPLVTAFAAALEATGGTNSEDAMKWGYEQITSSTEINAHYSVNESKNPSKFIVFMTDGENSTGSDWENDYADKQTIKYCDKAKDEGVTVFAVAFQAPKRGKDLLAACSSGSSFYYDADSADDLTKAFKDIGEEAVKQVTRLTS